MADEIGMEELYHKIKKKFEELENLRINSVRVDCDDLRQKIEEHRRIHEIAVTELRTQNGELKQALSKVASFQNEIRRFEDSVASLRHQLQARDPILNTFLKCPEFRVKLLDKDCYRISWGDQNQLEFDLLPHRESTGYGQKLLYRSIRFPQELANSPQTQFVRNDSISFDPRQIQGLCDTLRKGLQLCRNDRSNKPSPF